MISLRALVGRIDDAASEDLRQLSQIELDRGDDPEASAAPAHGPEQVGIVVGVHPALLTIGSHQLDRPHLVARKAVAAREPAEAAAGRVADDADVGCRTREVGKAVLAGGGIGLHPQHPRLVAPDALVGIDIDALHALSLEQDRAVQRPAGAGAVAGALGRDAEATRSREVDRINDIVGALGVGDSRRVLVGREVPSGARLIPVLLPGQTTVPAKFPFKDLLTVFCSTRSPYLSVWYDEAPVWEHLTSRWARLTRARPRGSARPLSQRLRSTRASSVPRETVGG